jgi:NADH dehydrogenase
VYRIDQAIMSKHLLIVGGGFAGLWSALAAAREAEIAGSGIAISLVSRDDHLTLRPRLYEPDPARFREPLRPILETVGVSLHLGNVCGIDAAGRRVALDRATAKTDWIGYDRLILAAGSALVIPDAPGVAEHTWNIDTHTAAMALDRHLHDIARTPNVPGHETIVIVGGGFTGIELATEMRTRLAAHSDVATSARARVILIERAEVVGPDLGAGPRPVIEAALTAARVQTRLGVEVTEASADALTLSTGERINTATIIVTTGVRANALTATLPVKCDELGRLPVDDYLRVAGVDGIYACGDVARAYVDETHLALMSCQHALRMGRFAGSNAACDLLSRPLRPYRQSRYVTCLDLGASGAVFTNGWQREVRMVGNEAKELKRSINGQRIYPPQGDRAALLAAAEIDPPAITTGVPT